MKAFDNVIVVDADGVLFYWEKAFINWMHGKGYNEHTLGHYELEEKYGITSDVAYALIAEFGKEYLHRLPPMRDAIKYIRKLHEEHGYVFHCLSAVSPTEENYKARQQNITDMFGKTAFEKLTLCQRSHEKDQLLSMYANTDCWFIDDLPKNCEYAVNHGINTILVTQHYNEDYFHPDIPRVTYWKEIYTLITGEI